MKILRALDLFFESQEAKKGDFDLIAAIHRRNEVEGYLLGRTTKRIFQMQIDQFYFLGFKKPHQLNMLRHKKKGIATWFESTKVFSLLNYLLFRLVLP